jgi:hypothetical protein
VAQGLEDEPNMLQMLVPCAAVDENVVKKYKHKPAEEGTQHVVHQCLECGGGVGEPERHDQELKVAMVRPECRLGDVLLVH